MNSGDPEAILRHVKSFGLTTEAAVASRWGEYGTELLEYLVTSKRVAKRGRLRNGETFYELADNQKRMQPPQRRYLLLAFCLLRQVERRPMPTQLLKELYPDSTSRALHCVESGKPSRFWRVYMPTTERADIQTARHIRQEVLETNRRLPHESTFRALLSQGHYGFAVLLDDQSRADKLRELLAERPLPSEIAVTVECFA
jgi:hypothetical protein